MLLAPFVGPLADAFVKGRLMMAMNALKVLGVCILLAGASPRGMSLLMRAARVAAWLAGRDHVRPEDLREVWTECVAHRLCLQPVYEMRREEIRARLMAGIVGSVAAP